MTYSMYTDRERALLRAMREASDTLIDPQGSRARAIGLLECAINAATRADPEAWEELEASPPYCRDCGALHDAPYAELCWRCDRLERECAERDDPGDIFGGIEIGVQ